MTGYYIYCQQCGLKNPGDSEFDNCEICHAHLRAPANEAQLSNSKVYAIDMKALPFKEILEAALGWRRALPRLLATPFVAWHIYLQRRDKKPWARPKFNDRLARFSRTPLDDVAGIDKVRLSRITSQLTRLGFKPAIDRILEATYTPLPQRIFINEKSNAYVMVTFYPVRGGMGLSVLTDRPDGKGMVFVSNLQPDFLGDPEVERIFIPGTGINGLLAVLDQESPPSNRPERRGDLAYIITALADSHKRIFDSAVENEILKEIDKAEAPYRYAETEGVPECSSHQGVIAVRKCSVCGKALCCACSGHNDSKDFCKDCLPEYAQSGKTPQIDFSGEFKPAGFFIRGSIRLLELIAFFWLMFVLFPNEAQPGSMIAYQGICLIGFITYFHFSVSYYGGTPLQRLAGLSVIDSLGERLPAPSALARTIYLFGALLTVVPIFGYLPALWDKYRRGWHDRMSGTIVVTTHAKVKEIIGAVVFAMILLYGGYTAPSIYEFAIDNISLSFERKAPNIQLNKVWRKKSTGMALLEKDKAAAIVGGELLAFDLSSGGVILLTVEKTGTAALWDASYRWTRCAAQLRFQTLGCSTKSLPS